MRSSRAWSREGMTEAELRRAKNLAAADFWRGVATIDGKARLLGEYAVMHGDYACCLRRRPPTSA